jgi:hypothetical protein
VVREPAHVPAVGVHDVNLVVPLSVGDERDVLVLRAAVPARLVVERILTARSEHRYQEDQADEGHDDAAAHSGHGNSSRVGSSMPDKYRGLARRL